MLHLAYGSNLLIERIRLPERCPGARPVGTARLDGWRLSFEKRGQDGSGKATVIRDASTFMHGVLYELPDEQRLRLDEVEGPGYRAHEVEVTVGRSVKAAWLYLGIDLAPAIRPFRWYRDLVLAGARQHGLPPQYAASIEAVATQQDSNQERAARMRRVLEAAGFTARDG